MFMIHLVSNVILGLVWQKLALKKKHCNTRNSTALRSLSYTFVVCLFNFTFSLSVKQFCEVRYSYKAQNEDELSLKEGDIVTILNKDCQDPGWWKGENNGKIGVFPDNFVVLLPQGSEDKKPIASSKVNDLKIYYAIGVQ